MRIACLRSAEQKDWWRLIIHLRNDKTLLQNYLGNDFCAAFHARGEMILAVIFS